MFRFNKITYILSRIFIAVIIVGILFPLIWILSLSFRDSSHIFQAYGFIIPKYLRPQNYLDALNFYNNVLEVNFFRMFLNSIIVTGATLLLAISSAAIASYAFSHLKFILKDMLYFLLVISMMIPAQILIIPLFYLFSKIKLLDTYLAIILPYTALGIPICVLILTSFFQNIPKELRDAAVIDGASDFTYFIKIVMPLSKAALATCVIFLFLFAWNEFLMASVFIKNNTILPVPVGMSLLKGGPYIVPWGVYAAAINLSIFPVLITFLVFQKWFIRGVTLGALKG